MSSVSALLTDPDSFFRDRSMEPSLRGGAVVVTLAVVIGLANTLVSVRQISAVMSDAGVDSTFILLTQFGSFVGALVGPYVMWVLYAGAFHAISVVFDGDGEFTTTMALVGWGFVANVVGSLVNLGITIYRWEVRGVDVPDLPDNIDLQTQEGAQQFGEAMQAVSTGPLVTLTTALGIVFTLWAAFLWTFAMKHARNLSVREAALTVALPVLVVLAFSVWGLVNAL